MSSNQIQAIRSLVQSSRRDSETDSKPEAVAAL